jgi:shikimate kinase
VDGGQTIAELFAQRGEEAFRQLEREALARTIILMDTVVATGGGVVLREENRALMRRKGWVIYLRASPETLWQRLQHATDRPLLRTESPSETLQAIAQAREPLYQEADWVIDTDALCPEGVADAIVRAFKPTPNAPLVIPVLPSQPNEYPVLVAPGVMTSAVQAILQRIQPTRVVIVTHPNLRTYADPLHAGFNQHGVPAHLMTLRRASA